MAQTVEPLYLNLPDDRHVAFVSCDLHFNSDRCLWHGRGYSWDTYQSQNADRQTDSVQRKEHPMGAFPILGDRVIITATKSDKLFLATEVYFCLARRVPFTIQTVAVR